MSLTTHLDLHRMGLRLDIPAGWDVDESGLSQGAVIVQDPDGWTDGFRPNMLLTQTPLTEHTSTEPDRVLAEQQAVDAVLADDLADYRLLHLGLEGLGQPAVSAVHRVGLYTTALGLPVTMIQWMARRDGRETTLTFTFPTADTHLGMDGGRALAGQLQWIGPTP